jgi:2-methylcitrate dehydratase PrpD
VTMTLGESYVMLKNHRDTHQVAATFGAAAAAACCAGLNAKQMRWILDYAAQQASGTNAWRRDTQHIEKSLCFAGFGARNGVTAALLISSGATGVDDIFSGEDNFFQAFAPEVSNAGMLDQLGVRYEITRTNIKRWTVGSPIQAPLDCLYNLFQRRSFTADDVEKVVVRVGTSGADITNNREMPDICMQHMVAVMLLQKTASFKAAHDVSLMKDPAVLRQRAKVQLIPDAELEKLYPRRAGIVEVTFKDGTVIKERVDDTRGTLENPMTRPEVVAKCQDLIAGYLGDEKAKQLIAKVLDCENLKDIRTLRPLLQRG